MRRRSFLAGAAVLAARPAFAAPAEAPWFDRWLQAFNTDDPRRYAAFVAANIPTLVPYLDDDLALQEATGGFALLRTEATAPDETTAWVRDRRWDRYSRVVLKHAGDRIADLAFLGASPPADFAVPRLSEQAAIDSLRRRMRAEAAAKRFSGTLLVARAGEVLLREAYGMADLATAAPVLPATRFCIGSMGKMFTAVATLQLVADQRLSLEEPIARWLPDYPNAALAGEVTVAQLLMHSGGTGDFFGPDYEAHRAKLRRPADFIAMFGQRAPQFEPGARFAYSNYGYMLLGALIERAADRPWEDVLAERIFAPTGMTATSAHADADTALPYTGAAAIGLKPLEPYVGLPPGGGYSTVDDLHAFGRALRSRTLLDDRHLALFTTARIPARDGHWSLGARLNARGGAACYGHGGSAPGVNADYAVYPASGYEVIVLSNRGHPHALNPADHIGLRLPIAVAR